jgi:glycogen synthase
VHGRESTGRAPRALRVLLVTQEYPPETAWGGIGTYAAILAPALVAAGAEVTVLSVVRGSGRSAVLGEDGVRVVRAPLRGVRGVGRVTGFAQAWQRVELARAVRREVAGLGAFDVVEAPEWGAEGLLLDLPVVVRLHSSAAQLFPYTLQGRGWRGLDGRAAIALEARGARRAALVTSTEANAVAGAEALGLDAARVRRIAHPVVPREPAPWRGGRRVLFAGRLEARKGPETLLRAAAEVPDATFVFAGRDAGSETELRALAERLGVDGRVEFLGQLDRAALSAQFAAATVVAVPSRWESFGNVVAEAALHGRPVVASDIPPFRELVAHGETGFLVDAQDPAAWAEAIRTVLRSPDAESMGAAGNARVRALGDPERIARETLAAYRDAIATA